MRPSWFSGYTKGMVGPQTKTADSDTLPLTSQQMDAFLGGAALFNRGEYFEAHEFWEKNWRSLPLPHRPQVQAAILTCGFFVLIRKARLDPAVRLANLAMERFAEARTQAKLLRREPALETLQVENRLLAMLARIRLGEADSTLLLAETRDLRVRVVGSEKEDR